MTYRKAIVISTIVTLLVAVPAVAQRRSSTDSSVPSTIQSQSVVTSERKSVLLSAVFSLVLPGMGEWYAGDCSAGKYNLIAEGGLWLTYGGLKLQSAWIRDDARTFAVQHAGAQMSGKDAKFEVNVGEYLSLDAYNQAMLRNRAYDQVYTASGYQWQWETAQQMTDYRALRIRSDRANNNARFAVAGLVVNRIVSAFAAARMASRHNAALSENRWQIDVRMTEGVAGDDGLEVHLRASF